MRVPVSRLAWLAVGALSVLCSVCSRSPAPLPPVDFLLSSADSTFWVTTEAGKLHVRGAPILFTRYDGRFYELYSADDDFSYDDALLIGQRLYRRDLTTGDSAIMFADTIVPRIALTYARGHPDERALKPNEEVRPDPSTTATAEIDILDVFGPYVSYEYHVDIELPDHRPWHTTRRGMIDLRSGRQVAVADLLGASVGAQLIAAGRRSYEPVRDSIARQRLGLRGDERRAADALVQLEFDDHSFIVESIDRRPVVTFGVPGRGEGAAGNIIELEPLAVDALPWWADVVNGIAEADTSSVADVDRWRGTGYTVIARWDTTGKIARVSIADSSRHEWPVATVTGPIHRVDWLDHPKLSDADRKSLIRAFNEAASYDEKTRVALLSFSRAKPRLSFSRAKRDENLLLGYAIISRPGANRRLQKQILHSLRSGG